MTGHWAIFSFRFSERVRDCGEWKSFKENQTEQVKFLCNQSFCMNGFGDNEHIIPFSGIDEIVALSMSWIVAIGTVWVEIAMWKLAIHEGKLLLEGPIFDFHDCGRKCSIDSRWMTMMSVSLYSFLRFHLLSSKHLLFQALFFLLNGGGAAETINERFATSLENFSGRSKKDNFSQSPHRFNL